MKRRDWKVEDITAGLYIIKCTADFDKTTISFCRTVTFKVGYDLNTKNTLLNGAVRGTCYGLSNSLTDGWYYPIGTKEQVVEALNDHPHGYRPLTKEEYLIMLNDSNQGFLEV